jgi:hypothetical protein
MVGSLSRKWGQRHAGLLKEKTAKQKAMAVEIKTKKINKTEGEVKRTRLSFAKIDDQTIPSFPVHMPLLYLIFFAMQGLYLRFY